MAFTSNDKNVATMHLRNRMNNCLTAISDFNNLRRPFFVRAREHGGTDRLRIFMAWIVVCDNNAIRLARCDLPHERALTLIAIAATAKDDKQPIACKRTQRCQNFFQRIRLMCIVNKNWRAVFFANALKATWRALQGAQSCKNSLWLCAAYNCQSRRHKRIRYLKSASKRQINGVVFILKTHQNLRRRSPKLYLAHADRIAINANVKCNQPSRFDNFRHAQSDIAISVNHHGSTSRQQDVKETHLGGKITFHILMMIKMIAREVCKSGSTETHAVKSPLFNAQR